jgi:hypothetical protein
MPAVTVQRLVRRCSQLRRSKSLRENHLLEPTFNFLNHSGKKNESWLRLLNLEISNSYKSNKKFHNNTEV